jgi:hypothetical protein
VLTANLSPVAAELPAPIGRDIWVEGLVCDSGRHGPWAVRWAIASAAAARGPSA